MPVLPRKAAALLILLWMAAVHLGCSSYQTTIFDGEVPAGVFYHDGKVWVLAAELRNSPSGAYVPKLYQVEPTQPTERKLFRRYQTEIYWDLHALPALAATLEFPHFATDPTVWAIHNRETIGRLTPAGSLFRKALKDSLGFLPDDLRHIYVTAERSWLLAVRKEPFKTVLIEVFEHVMQPAGEWEDVLGADCNIYECWLGNRRREAPSNGENDELLQFERV